MISSKDITTQLRNRGERITIQRRLVIDILCETGDHLSMGDIQERLQTEGQDLSDPTVYRILQWLKAQGMISQTDLGGSGIVYQVIGNVRHHHLVCFNCDKVISLNDAVMDGLRERLRSEYNFEPRIDHMAIFGLCEDCQAEAPIE